MTNDEFDELYDNDYDLQDAHGEWLMTTNYTPIGNGTMLINALEAGVGYEDFRDYYIEKAKNK